MANQADTPHSGYHIDYEEPLDQEILDANQRSWMARWVSLGISTALAVGIPMWLGHVWLGKFGILLGLFASGAILVPLMNQGLIDVAEWDAFGTLDRLTGKIVPYGPGLHASHWWERRKKENNASLKARTKEFTVTVPTKGSAVLVTFSYQYGGEITRLANFLGIRTAELVDKGYQGFLESFVFTEIAGKMDADQAMASVDDLNEKLSVRFKGLKSKDNPKGVTDFEMQYGLKTVSVVVSGITLPEEVQKTRNAMDEGVRIFGIMASLRGVTPEVLSQQVMDKEITENELALLRTQAMATSGQGGVNVDSLQLPGLFPAVFGGQSSGKKK